jgi:hypothetical protein
MYMKPAASIYKIHELCQLEDGGRMILRNVNTYRYNYKASSMYMSRSSARLTACQVLRVTTCLVSVWHPHLISGKPSPIVLQKSDPLLWFSVRHVVELRGCSGFQFSLRSGREVKWNWIQFRMIYRSRGFPLWNRKPERSSRILNNMTVRYSGGSTC